MEVPASSSRRSAILGGAAGVAMPVSFTLLGFLQTTLTPNYSMIAQPVSALAIEPLGWIQNLNFVLAGLLYSVFALGLRDSLGSKPAIGPWFHVLAGAGLVILGIFPWTRVNGEPTEPIGHTIGSFLAFLPAAIGFILTARAMSKNPAWRSYAPLGTVTGILMIVIFFAFGALAEARDTPLHPWEGIIQRVLGNLWLACTFILGLRLMRLARVESTRFASV